MKRIFTSGVLANPPQPTYSSCSIACGKTDNLFAASQSMSDTLDKRQIHHKFVPSEEGHVWRNWRDYLADFTPQLFR